MTNKICFCIKGIKNGIAEDPTVLAVPERISADNDVAINTVLITQGFLTF